MEIRYKNQLIGLLQPDEMDPPFGSGFFTFAESPEELFLVAKNYLVFTHQEFELREGSKAYNEFGDRLETDFADLHFGEDWSLHHEDGTLVNIYQPMLSKEGLMVWSFE